MNALFLKKIVYKLQNGSFRDGATSSDIQSMKWKSSMCFTLACLVFIYLTVNSTVFHCEWKPHFQLTLESTMGWGVGPPLGVFLERSEGMSYFSFLPSPGKKKPLENPRETIPHVLWCLVNSKSTTGHMWTFGIAFPIVIWQVLKSKGTL